MRGPGRPPALVELRTHSGTEGCACLPPRPLTPAACAPGRAARLGVPLDPCQASDKEGAPPLWVSRVHTHLSEVLSPARAQPREWDSGSGPWRDTRTPPTLVYAHAMHMYTHTHTYMHTRTRASTRVRICPCVHTRMHMHAYVHVHTRVHALARMKTACVHTCTRVHVYMHMCACACTHPKHTCTHLHAHACTHACTHTHTTLGRIMKDRGVIVGCACGLWKE